MMEDLNSAFKYLFSARPCMGMVARCGPHRFEVECAHNPTLRLQSGQLQHLDIWLNRISVSTLQVPLLATPVVPFFPFYFGVSVLKLNIFLGTLMIKGLLGTLHPKPLNPKPLT